MEYAVILFLLKKKRKPFRTIDQGLKHLFTSSTNGEAAQPLRSPSHREEKPPQVTLNFLAKASSFLFFCLHLLFSPRTHSYSVFEFICQF